MKITHNNKIYSRLAEDVFDYMRSESELAWTGTEYDSHTKIYNAVNEGHLGVAIYTKKHNDVIILHKGGKVPERYTSPTVNVTPDKFTDVIGCNLFTYDRSLDTVTLYMGSDRYPAASRIDKGMYLLGHKVFCDYIQYNYPGIPTYGVASTSNNSGNVKSIHSHYMTHYSSTMVYTNPTSRRVSDNIKVNIATTPTTMNESGYPYRTSWLRNSIKQVNAVIQTYPKAEAITCNGILPFPTATDTNFYEITYNDLPVGYINLVQGGYDETDTTNAYCRLIAWSPKCKYMEDPFWLSEYQTTQFRAGLRRWMMYFDIDNIVFTIPVGYLDRSPGQLPLYTDPIYAMLPLNIIQHYRL